MHRLDMLDQQAQTEGIIVDYSLLEDLDELDGLYIHWDDLDVSIILVNSYRCLDVQVAVLAEELGHHYRSSGVILNQSTVVNRKSENAGRQYAYDVLLPAGELNIALHTGSCNVYELAERFSLPEAFVKRAVDYHVQKGHFGGLNVRCHWCCAS